MQVLNRFPTVLRHLPVQEPAHALLHHSAGMLSPSCAAQIAKSHNDLITCACTARLSLMLQLRLLPLHFLLSVPHAFSQLLPPWHNQTASPPSVHTPLRPDTDVAAPLNYISTPGYPFDPHLPALSASPHAQLLLHCPGTTGSHMLVVTNGQEPLHKPLLPPGLLHIPGPPGWQHAG